MQFRILSEDNFFALLALSLLYSWIFYFSYGFFIYSKILGRNFGMVAEVVYHSMVDYLGKSS